MYKQNVIFADNFSKPGKHISNRFPSDFMIYLINSNINFKKSQL